MIRAARNPDAAMAGKLGEVLQSMGQSLEKDPRMKRAINQFARRAVAGMAASYGGSIVKLVSETVRRWDARRSPTGSKPRSAATSNISASTARWSAAWSGWCCTRWTRCDRRNPRRPPDAEQLVDADRRCSAIHGDVTPGGASAFASSAPITIAPATRWRSEGDRMVIGPVRLHDHDRHSIARGRSAGSRSWNRRRGSARAGASAARRVGRNQRSGRRRCANAAAAG
jgi:hypothetical protein